MVKRSQTLSRMVKNSQGWSSVVKIGKNSQGWSRVVKRSQTLSNNSQTWPDAFLWGGKL